MPRRTCSAPGVSPIAEGTFRSLHVTDDFIYYIDVDDGPPVEGSTNAFLGTVKRYAFASGETIPLYTAQRDVIRDLLVTADALYVYTASRADDLSVYRLPLSGEGTPELVGPVGVMSAASDARNALMGVVGGELVVDGAGGGTVAVSLTDGSVRRLLPADPYLVSLQLSGDQLWYASDRGNGPIFRLDVANPMSTPVEVYPEGCSAGPTGWFLASPSELSCGGSRSIRRLALDGSGETGSWDISSLIATTYLPVYGDSDALYFASVDYGALVPRMGGSPEYFSCEAVPVDGISGNAEWLVWGRSFSGNAGVILPATPLIYGPNTFDAIFARRR